MEHNSFSFLEDSLKADFQTTSEMATVYQLHDSLTRTIMKEIADTWKACEVKQSQQRRAYYFSAEFLVGRAIFNNLLALGKLEPVREFLKSQGRELNEFEEIEDAALGNGGLGRLAACFLDSAATMGYPLNGYGIRYKYGLFAQHFENGFQKESADDWTAFGDPWSIRRNKEVVMVSFADETVKAVPYDMPIIGYGGKQINTLRLWQSEALTEFDFDAFNRQQYTRSVADKNKAEDISRVLYPNDDTNKGKELRIRQQYFFCSASIQDMIRRHVKKYGANFEKFAADNSVQLNDTHPTVAICEFIRILCDDYQVDFVEALRLARKIFNYTNHTVMAEALEKWDYQLYRGILPRICDIIKKLNHYQSEEFMAGGELFQKHLKSCRILDDHNISMANLAIFGSNVVNGVAKIHTEILKTDVLKNWYELYPERFQNKTNGITQRRWLALCNPELSAMISRLLGSEEWITDLNQLRKLESDAEKPEILREFLAIKSHNKQRLADYIREKEGVDIPAHFLFDIQIKRLHEYKRQLLNAFSILDIYYGIKSGRIVDFTPTAFIFGAKAAPGYFRAKGVIKFINEIAKMINSDPEVKAYLRVVFVQNYNVSYAEKLVCAADLSEQISPAGTEASGTGNMKLMLNGAPTLGTFDGANVEIVHEAGLENNYIFGATVEDINKIKNSYDPKIYYEKEPRLKKVVDALVDGSFDDGGTGMFKDLHDALLVGASWHKADQYYLLLDFMAYMNKKLEAIAEYKNELVFAQKAFLNVARAGYFSSDRTIREYAKDIWQID